MKSKTLMMGLCMAMMAFALPTAYATLMIKNAQVAEVSDTTALLNWTTNENATTVARYGVGDYGQVQQIPALTAVHTISLQGLQRNVTYNVSMVSCNASGDCISVNKSFLTTKDSDAPPINLSIPSFVNRRSIDIKGSTEPYSEVSLYVNNFNVPLRFLGRSDTGASGRIEFRDIILQNQNSIRILMRDRAGNLNERIFDVRVDVEKPIVALQPFPAIISGANVSFIGTVNEPVTLKMWVRSAKDVKSPSKTIRNFKNQSIRENSVTLSWNPVDDPDFSHYVLRRQDIGPIAVMHPSSYASYTDILVDAGKQYSYTLSYMNRFGIESAMTNATVVWTPSQGLVLGIRPPVVDTMADFSTPTAQTNSSGAFSMSSKVNSDDGSYILKLEATDRAGNVFTIERTVEKDTKKPEITLLTPRQDAQVFENYANEVDVEGTTEPGAMVHLYINRAPFQCNTTAGRTFSMPRLLSDIKNLPDSDFTSATSKDAGRVTFCPLTADKTTIADATGKFHFEDVDMYASLAFAFGARDLSPEELSALSTSTNTQSSKITQMVLIATDKAGLREAITSRVMINNCWSGNITWDVIPLTEFQTPTLLSTERLAENTETVYFYFNYSYIGRGSNAKIKSVSMQKACGTVEVLDSRFNTSCRIMPGGGNAQLLNPPENTLSYTALTLNRVENMDRWLEGDWKDFFKSFNNELSFPLKLTITYEHDVQGRKITETQTSCQEVSYVMDNSRIDPRKVLPDWLLYDFVDLLNSSIHTIKQVQDQIDVILPYIATACSTSYMASFGTATWRNWQEMFTEKKIVVTQAIKDKAGGIAFVDVSFGENQAYCEYLIKGFIYNPKYGNGLNFKLNWLSDADLNKCFPEIAAAWDYEATTYQAYRYTCDRLFGHVSPAGWTETKSDTELVNKVQQGSNCANDATPKGQVVRKIKCEEAAKATAYQGKTLPTLLNGDYCLEIFQTTTDGKQQKSLYKLGNVIDPATGLTEISIGTSDKPQVELGAVIKVTEDNYLAPQKDTCNQLCGGTSTTSLGAPETEFIPKDGNVGAALGKTDGKKAGVCTTAKQCIDWNSPNNPKNPIKIKDKDYIIDRAERKGYTKGCFYGGGRNELNSYSAVGKSLADRYECCCVYEKGVKSGYSYYESTDSYLDMGEMNTMFVGADEMGAPSKEILPIHKTKETEKPSDYKPLEWSYRYAKIKFRARGNDGFEHIEYNPYRYIEGRDFPACFGQDMWFDTEKGVMTLDPARNHLATLQCANIGGIRQRLTLITNIMSSMQTCLIQVRTTGRGDTGACKELFTQHVCSLTWDAIQFFLHFNNNCASSDLQAPSGDANQDSVVDYLKTGAKGIMNAMSDQQSQFMSEYGNVKMNSAFGAGAEETARKICLAAFGYEWPFSAKSLLDISYAQPFATLVQPITASRDLLSVDPKTGQAKIEYRGSWIINPGCDFANYKVELACIGRDSLDQQANSWGGAPLENGADCTKQRSPDGINCPCLDTGEKVQTFFSSSTKLKQNVLEERADHKVITSPYRYDHIKVTLLPDPKVDPKLRSRCFPEGRERGVFYFPITDRTARDVLNCRIEPMSGVLMCNSGAGFFGQKGFAYFNELFVGENDPLKDGMQVLTGKSFTIRGSIFKAGGDKCLIAKITRPYVKTMLLSQIVQNGTWPFGPVLVSENLVLSTRQQVQSTDPKISAIPVGSTTTTTVSFRVTFKDVNKNAQLDADDEATVDGSAPFKPYTSTTLTSPDGKTSIVADGSSITATKEGQTIKIAGVDFTNTGGPAVTERSATLTMYPPADATAETKQTMTLILTLNNFRKDASPTGDIGDCNLNEITTSPEGVEQLRKFDIELVNTDSNKNALAPRVTNQRFEPSPFQGQTTELSMLVTKPNSEIEVKEVRAILVSDPLGSLETDTEGRFSGDAGYQVFEGSPKSNMELTFRHTYSLSDFLYAGTYMFKPIVKYTLPGKTEISEVNGPTASIDVSCAEGGTCRPRPNNNLTKVPDNCQVITPSSIKECVPTQICCRR